MTEQLNCSILIFEDDPVTSTMLKAFFQKQGATVIHADSGKNALQIITETAPDILILDIMMPYKDGFTIIKELREVDVDLPVLFLTDKSRVDDRVKGLELGADDYIPKPFSLKELQARIRAQLRRLERSKIPQKQVVQIGPLPLTRNPGKFLLKRTIRCD